MRELELRYVELFNLSMNSDDYRARIPTCDLYDAAPKGPKHAVPLTANQI